jgi:hypothetical protein
MPFSASGFRRLFCVFVFRLAMQGFQFLFFSLDSSFSILGIYFPLYTFFLKAGDYKRA